MAPGILDYLRCIIYALVLPFLSGIGFTELLKGRKSEEKDEGISPVFSLIAGYLLLWSLMELIAVLGTILKVPFKAIALIVLGLSVIISIYGLIVYIRRIRNGKGVIKYALLSVFKSKTEIALFVIFLIIFAAFLYMNINTLFFDADDSRFLVSAGDILRSNHILSTDPVTGKSLDTGYRDFKKDLISQWAAFIAYSSYVTGINTTVFAHFVYPVIAMTLIFSIYWLLMKKEETTNKVLAMILLVALFIFGNYSTHSQETVSIIRVWQGKATLAVFGVLTVIYLFKEMYDKEKLYPGDYVLLLTANLSLSLMSSMGMVIAGIMIVAYGAYMIYIKRNIKYLIPLVIICIPNVLLFILSEVYTIERFIG